MEENRKSIISEEELTINLNGENSEVEINRPIGKRTARRAEEKKKSSRIAEKKKNLKEKKKISKKKIAIIIISILAILIAIAGIVFGRYVYKAGGDVKQAAISMTKDVATTIVGKDEPIFVLVLGISEDITSKLTDTIILAGYNPETQKAFMVSIPRDTFVGTNEANASGWDKINALYQKDISKTIKAVEERTGVNIDKYVIVRNTMLPAMVNAIGDVEFDVPIDMDYDDPTQDLHIHLKAGVQMINGDKAEQLLRFRHNNNGTSYPSSWGDNDYGRMRTQREFIKAVAQKLISLDNVTNIKGIAEAVFSNLETNMSIGDLIGYIPYAIDFNVDDIRMEQLPGSGAMLNKLSFYKASHTRSKKLMDELINYLGLDAKETKKYYTGKIKQTIAATPEAEKQDACEHKYKTEIIKASTCKEQGERKYTCELCDSTYTETIATSNHDYDENGICIICNANKEDTEHVCKFTKVVNIELPATCINDGEGTYACESETCGKKKNLVIKATGKHIYGEDGKCTTPGCTAKKEMNNEVPKDPVEPQPPSTPPVNPPHVHSFTGTVTTKPTCTEAGVKTFTCSCGEGTYTEVIGPTGHNFTDTTKPTCANCLEPNTNYVPPVQSTPPQPENPEQQEN